MDYEKKYNEAPERAKAYHRLELTVSQHAEWSEEDEKNFEYLHQVICTYINNPQIEYKEREKASKELIPFLERLKSLRGKFVKEDEK